MCMLNKASHDCEPMSNDRINISYLKSLDREIHILGMHDNDVSSVSKAKDASNVARWNKRLNRQSEANFLEEIKDVSSKLLCSVLFLPLIPGQVRMQNVIKAFHLSLTIVSFELFLNDNR